MTTAFEELTAGLTNRPGAHLAQALNMDPDEMFNAWTRNIAAAIEDDYDDALADAETHDRYMSVLAVEAESMRDWSARMIAIKGLTPDEVRALLAHDFRVSDIVIDCWAVNDGAERLRRFIPNGDTQ